MAAARAAWPEFSLTLASPAVKRIRSGRHFWQNYRTSLLCLTSLLKEEHTRGTLCAVNLCLFVLVAAQPYVTSCPVTHFGCVSSSSHQFCHFSRLSLCIHPFSLTASSALRRVALESIPAVRGFPPWTSHQSMAGPHKNNHERQRSHRGLILNCRPA